MPFELTTIFSAAPGRLIGMSSDGTLQLVWDNASIRLPLYDLPHLAALLEAWFAEEEAPVMRRGYYRLFQSPDGGLQLWINSAGLLLSREDLRLFAGLIEAAESELCGPLCRQPQPPFGPGFRPLTPVPATRQHQN